MVSSMIVILMRLGSGWCVLVSSMNVVNSIVVINVCMCWMGKDVVLLDRLSGFV